MRETVKNEVITVLEDISEADEVSEEMYLLDDLELSSIDVFTLLADLEVRFNTSIPEKYVRRMETVSDIVDVILELTNQN